MPKHFSFKGLLVFVFYALQRKVQKLIFTLLVHIKSVQKGITTEINIRMDVAVKYNFVTS